MVSLIETLEEPGAKIHDAEPVDQADSDALNSAYHMCHFFIGLLQASNGAKTVFLEQYMLQEIDEILSTQAKEVETNTGNAEYKRFYTEDLSQHHWTKQHHAIQPGE